MWEGIHFHCVVVREGRREGGKEGGREGGKRNKEGGREGRGIGGNYYKVFCIVQSSWHKA